MNKTLSSAVWVGLVLCFLAAGVAVPLAIAKSGSGGTVQAADAASSSNRTDLTGLPPQVQQDKLDAERQAKQKPPSSVPADTRPRLTLPKQDVGAREAVNAARGEAARLIAEDQKLLDLPDLPAQAAGRSIDDASKERLSAYKAELPQRTRRVWSSGKAAERAKQCDEQTSARITAGGLPQADDARFEVSAWHAISASDSEIVGSVDGWINQHWINPVASRGSVSVDSSGWQVFNPGLLRTFQFRLVKEADGWHLDVLYANMLDSL